MDKIIEEMDKAARCLYLELPSVVADGVKKRWEAAKQSQSSRIKELEEALEAWQNWEADLIRDNEMWWPHSPKDHISGKTYDRMLELQQIRNKLLGKSTPTNQNK